MQPLTIYSRWTTSSRRNGCRLGAVPSTLSGRVRRFERLAGPVWWVSAPFTETHHPGGYGPWSGWSTRWGVPSDTSPRATTGPLDGEPQKAGVSPHYIDTVVLTHLHADHVGWNLEAEGSDRQLTFNRAPYLIHQADWDTCTRQAAHYSWVEQTVTPLQSLAALDLTSTDRSLTRDVTALHTPGHTPGHMCVLVASAEQRAIIGGDVIVHPAR
jgi:hypothetical protein